MVEHTEEIVSLELVDDILLASVALDSRIKIWDLSSGICVKTIVIPHSHVGVIKTIARNMLAGGQRSGTIRIWDLVYGECVRVLTGHQAAVESLELLPGNRLCSGAHDRVIKVWDFINGNCLMSLVGHLYGVSSLQLMSIPNINAFDDSMTNEQISDRITEQQQELLISTSVDTTLKVWNISSGTCVGTHLGFPSSFSMVVGKIINIFF